MLNAIFKDARERGKDGKATTRKARSALHKAFEDAIDDVLPYDFPNPARKVKIPAEQTKMMTPWIKDEAERFVAVAKASRHWPILHMALTGGLREGGLCALRWEDLEPVELEAQGETRKYLLIHVRHTLISVPERHRGVAHLKLKHLTGRYYLDTPKTKKSLVSVLVAEDTLEVLQAHRLRQQRQMTTLGDRYQDFDLVFPATTGVPQSPRNLLRDYKALIHKAAVPDLSFHDLRDTHSSRLQALGKELAVVLERLRHSRKSTTADKYTHTLSVSRIEGAVTLAELFKR